MNFLSLLPILLSVLGRNKPDIENAVKSVIDKISDLPKDELEEAIETVDIREAQEKLAALGYDPGPIDGYSGPRTRAAVKQFQEDNNLLVDGLIGQKTWASLMADDAQTQGVA